MATYPESLLQPGEHVLEHRRPHWRMLVVPALLPPALALPAGFLAATVSTSAWRPTVWIALAVVVVALVVWFSLAPLARWRFTHLVVTDRRLLVREGVVSRAGIDLAAFTVSEVRIRQTPTERALGCGTLVVLTRAADGDPADGGRARWEFEGIGRVARVAARLEGAAEQQGGIDPRDDWGTWDEDEPDEPDLDDAVDRPRLSKAAGRRER